VSKKLIIFYKSKCLEPIHKELVKSHAYSIREVDELIKHLAKIEKSCLEMTKDELNEIIVTAFRLADEIGLKGINYPDNECEFIKNIL
jgi:hypothetical protein